MFWRDGLSIWRCPGSWVWQALRCCVRPARRELGVGARPRKSRTRCTARRAVLVNSVWLLRENELTLREGSRHARRRMARAPLLQPGPQDGVTVSPGPDTARPRQKERRKNLALLTRAVRSFVRTQVSADTTPTRTRLGTRWWQGSATRASCSLYALDAKRQK